MPKVRHRINRGPHPLGQHLAGIAQMWQSGLVASASARVGMFAWHESVGAEATSLAKSMGQVSPEQLAGALVAEAQARMAAFQRGVDAYRRSAHYRPVDTRPVVWRKGRARLLGPRHGAAGRPPVLVVPSLINTWHALDLDPGHGLISRLELAGLAPYVLDWGQPGTREARFDCGDYVSQLLLPALDWLADHSAKPVGVMGQCLGGVLALGLGSIAPTRISAIGLLATPWDFSLMRPTHLTAGLMAQGGSLQQVIYEGAGILPADLVSAVMALSDSGLIEAKYRQFADMDQTSAAARQFVLIEDWAQTAIPLARKVGAQIFRDWPQGQGPAQGQFQIMGRRVVPAEINLPCLMVQSDRDRLTPPSAALSLAQALPNIKVLTPSGGHLGMAIGREAGEIALAISQFFLDHGPVSSYRGTESGQKKPTNKKNRAEREKSKPRSTGKPARKPN